MPEAQRTPEPGLGSPLAAAAERLAARIQSLVDEVAMLRQENAGLRTELRAAISMLERSAGARPSVSKDGHRAAPPARRKRRSYRRRAGRATPPEVTAEVVRAVIVKLGEATASQIAAEISGAGAAVSGRAVRFLAERAGAQSTTGADGQRRYRMG